MLCIFLNLDDGGIYKGRLNHRERVREIDETRDTKVDLPVDYREVETVEDETLYGKNGVSYSFSCSKKEKLRVQIFIYIVYIRRI